jgi:HSP20 family molecular chaperone IbpA
MSALLLPGRRDPFAEFDAIMRSAFAPTLHRTAALTPPAEVRREGDDMLVRLDVAGLDAERDLAVELDGEYLVISGQRRDERAEDTGGHLLREWRYGTFQRSFALPRLVEPDAVGAEYDAGVLTVRVAGAYAGTGPARVPVRAVAATRQEAITQGEEKPAA